MAVTTFAELSDGDTFVLNHGPGPKPMDALDPVHYRKRTATTMTDFFGDTHPMSPTISVVRVTAIPDATLPPRLQNGRRKWRTWEPVAA